MRNSSIPKLTNQVEEAIRLASRTPISKSDLPRLKNIVAWLQDLNQADLALIESLAVRRDMVTLLRYFKEKRPVGTQSTGNLQLKAVREVCAQFVNPPKLDETIGTKFYTLRSEDDVWPLYYLHTLANIGGFITGGQARTWKLTSEGEAFLSAHAPIQLGLMLALWWYRTDWRIAFPVSGLDRGLPSDFNKITLKRLLELPTGKSVSYESFADNLVKETHITWAIADQEMAKRILRSAIERLVILPVAMYDILEREYGVEDINGHEFSKLSKIRLTSVGKGLLETL